MRFLTVPTGILSFAAILIFLITRLRKKIGVAWFIGALASFSVWCWIFYLKRTPESVFSIRWQNLELSFILDNISWSYMAATATMLFFMMASAPSRLNPDSSSNDWGFFLLITTIVIATVASDSGWSMVFGWFLFDLLTVGVQFFSHQKIYPFESLEKILFIRIFSIFLAAVAIAIGNSIELNPEQSFLEGQRETILLIACAMRAGLFPFFEPFQNENETRKGLNTFVELSSVALVLPAFIRIDSSAIGNDAYGFFIFFSTLSVICGGLGMIFSNKNESERRYFVLTLTGLSFISALRFQPIASVVWGISLSVLTAPLFLYDIRSRLLNVVQVISGLLLSGLPRTPAASGWQGLVLVPPSFFDFFLMISFACLLTKFFSGLTVQNPAHPALQDRRMNAIYPFGFIVSMIAYGVIAALSWNFYSDNGMIPASIITLIIAFIIGFRSVWLRFFTQTNTFFSWFREIFFTIWKIFLWIIQFRWLEAPIGWIMNGLSAIIDFISGIFEAPGGILWKFLILIIVLFLVIGI